MKKFSHDQLHETSEMNIINSNINEDLTSLQNALTSAVSEWIGGSRFTNEQHEMLNRCVSKGEQDFYQKLSSKIVDSNRYGCSLSISKPYNGVRLYSLSNERISS